MPGCGRWWWWWWEAFSCLLLIYPKALETGGSIYFPELSHELHHDGGTRKGIVYHVCFTIRHVALVELSPS